MEKNQENQRPVKVYEIDSSLKLTAKQAAFVYEYLKDYNQTQAAIRAGYSPRSANQVASANMAKHNIALAIDDGKWFYQYQNGIDADWIRKKRIELYNRCTQAEPVLDRDGEPTGEYTFRDTTAKGLLADMAKDIGMDEPTQVNVNQSGTVTHEHTVKEQMNFDAVRMKVEKHKEPQSGLH